MSVPSVSSCCCCIGLQTGTLIIGYFYTLLALLELFLYTLIVSLRPQGALSPHKYVFYVATAAVSFVQLLCGVLLVVGATKRRASLMLPWTIVTGVLSAVFLVLCFTGASLILQDSGNVLGEEAFMIFFHLARSCISIYCLLVVHSRHKQIMREKQDQRFCYSARLYAPVRTEHSDYT